MGQVSIISLHTILACLPPECDSNLWRVGYTKPKAMESKHDMSAGSISSSELITKLKAHPQINVRLHSLLSLIDNEIDHLREADAAEFRIIDEMREQQL